MNIRFDIIFEYRYMFLYGALITICFTLIGILGGTIIGLFNALARIIRFEKAGPFTRFVCWVLRTVSLIYVTIFRGTPLFVQIFIWYYVWSPSLIHFLDGWLVSDETIRMLQLNRAWFAGALALIANAGAYITEIFRAGIQSIDRGQIEAARSLGMNYFQAMRYVILPQALRRMLPPLANEFITLLKDSSLLSAIGGVAEIAYVQKTIYGRYNVYEEPLYTGALIYLLMTICLSWIFIRLENKYRTHQN